MFDAAIGDLGDAATCQRRDLGCKVFVGADGQRTKRTGAMASANGAPYRRSTAIRIDGLDPALIVVMQWRAFDRAQMGYAAGQ